LTWKHEKLIQAVFQGCGYRCQPLSNPTLSSYHLGRQFGNSARSPLKRFANEEFSHSMSASNVRPVSDYRLGLIRGKEDDDSQQYLRDYQFCRAELWARSPDRVLEDDGSHARKGAGT
jgi:hypothetical protein